MVVSILISAMPIAEYGSAQSTSSPVEFQSVKVQEDVEDGVLYKSIFMLKKTCTAFPNGVGWSSDGYKIIVNRVLLEAQLSFSVPSVLRSPYQRPNWPHRTHVLVFLARRILSRVRLCL